MTNSTFPPSVKQNNTELTYLSSALISAPCWMSIFTHFSTSCSRFIMLEVQHLIRAVVEPSIIKILKLNIWNWSNASS